jgi:hypothetical protein
MATTMIPHPQPSPPARPSPGVSTGAALRFVAVRANLMPDEVIDARRTEIVRRRVLIGLACLLALILVGFGSAWLQTESSKGDLSDQQHRSAALRDQQHDYAPLVAAQGLTQTINDKLHQLMVGDVDWNSMYGTIRSDAPAGVGITSVSAQITTAAAGTGTSASNQSPYFPINPTGTTPIGTLTVVGTAADKDQVAGYADRLGTETGLLNPVISSVTATARPFTFTIVLTLTADALGGRYHVANPATQGGN